MIHYVQRFELNFSAFLRKIIYGTNKITKSNCQRFKELIKKIQKTNYFDNWIW